LRGLAETLVVPSAVADEISAGPESDAARQWLTGPGKEHIRDAGELEPIVGNWDLGQGEGQVLSWAFRHPGFEVILDDLAARKCAAALSIPIRGTLGIHLLANKEGHLGMVEPVLLRIQQAGLYISPDVLEAVRRLAGER
jgi:predicted nucleic acid-binding protein